MGHVLYSRSLIWMVVGRHAGVVGVQDHGQAIGTDVRTITRVFGRLPYEPRHPVGCGPALRPIPEVYLPEQPLGLPVTLEDGIGGLVPSRERALRAVDVEHLLVRWRPRIVHPTFPKE